MEPTEFDAAMGEPILIQGLTVAEAIAELNRLTAECARYKGESEGVDKLLEEHKKLFAHCEKLAAENERLRGLLHEAGHSFQEPHWAIDWQPILDVMAEVDAAKDAERSAEREE